MELEERYIVIKIEDTIEALSTQEQLRLRGLIQKINRWRNAQGKENRYYICISDKWKEEYRFMKHIIEQYDRKTIEV